MLQEFRKILNEVFKKGVKALVKIQNEIKNADFNE